MILNYVSTNLKFEYRKCFKYKSKLLLLDLVEEGIIKSTGVKENRGILYTKMNCVIIASKLHQTIKPILKIHHETRFSIPKHYTPNQSTFSITFKKQKTNPFE
jgi:hypothetical protein